MQDKEEWISINGYDYNYMISSHGRFMNTNPFHKKLANIPKVGSRDKRGYMITSLVKDGKSIDKKVHRLVAEAFLHDYDDELLVNHKDLNKENNHISNLEMTTCKENVRHYHINVTSGNVSSEKIGVNFHKGIDKWCARVYINGKRFNIGTFCTEKEAIDCLDNYEVNGIGQLNKGKRKYNKNDIAKILNHHKEHGVRKTIKNLNVGTSTLYRIIKGTYER